MKGVCQCLLRDGIYCVFVKFKVFVLMAFTIKVLILKWQWDFEDEFRI